MTYCQNKVTDRWAVWRQSRVQAPYSVIAPPLESHGRQLYRLAMPSPAAQRTIAVSHSIVARALDIYKSPHGVVKTG